MTQRPVRGLAVSPEPRRGGRRAGTRQPKVLAEARRQLGAGFACPQAGVCGPPAGALVEARWAEPAGEGARAGSRRLPGCGPGAAEAAGGDALAAQPLREHAAGVLKPGRGESWSSSAAKVPEGVFGGLAGARGPRKRPWLPTQAGPGELRLVIAAVQVSSGCPSGALQSSRSSCSQTALRRQSQLRDSRALGAPSTSAVIHQAELADQSRVDRRSASRGRSSSGMEDARGAWAKGG